MFRRVLIANRGEIALRIARACGAVGAEPVMVCSTADRDAPWLDHAAEVVCLGPPAPGRSYLDQDAVLQAALQTDCQAVHPGYGFLSENAVFAARCTQQGLTFVGPSPSAIRSMGDKAQAKSSMKAVGLPTIPGSDGILPDVEAAVRLAERIGYPVLVKATAGGGGKGMRRCRDEAELRRGFEEASREAASAFGNPQLYLEKLIVGGRHVEFQVLVDGFGHGVHLFERECSIQRQHQKLIEEAPSPALDDAARKKMGVKVARAVARLGYRNAGTVEFLYDADGAFHFMEMNTRLQVEHPVTEICTGLDIVAAQLRIAADEPLEWKQGGIELSGHAVEFRINAEDPEAGFRPDPGTITRFRLPDAPSGLEVRWDSAVREGWKIPPNYDSMIGKLIVHGPDRASVLEGSRAVLQGLEVGGVKTTIPLHLRLLDDPGFRSGEYDVDHLTRAGLAGVG